MAKGVWILTSEYNDHDQHGEYFEAAFENKPSLKELAEFFTSANNMPRNVMEAVAFLEHVLAGGGRQKNEQQWWNLSLVPFANSKEK